MHDVLQDLRYAARMLRKSPGFTAAGVLTLALGIGATTAIFSVVDTVVLRPLPFPDPDRLVRVWETNPAGDDFSISESNYLDFRDRNRTLQELAAYKQERLTLTGVAEPERLEAVATTHDLFGLVGGDPVLGRTFTAAEDRPGGERVAILGHRLWQRRFDGDPGVLGESVMLNGSPHAIVGVMEPGFDFPGAEIWVPLAPDPAHDRGDHWLDGIGRLAPGATVEGAQRDLVAIAARIGEDHPHVAGWGARVESLTTWMVGPEFRRTITVLLGAVGLLLLMACANLANLLFARATTRRTEIGIRAALGADRARLVRQLLTESFLLALLGSVLGVLGAVWLVEGLVALDPAGIPRLDEVAVDGRVVAFGMTLGILTSLVFGVIPSMRASRTDLGQTLRQGVRGGTEGHGRTRDALVVAQVALAIVLLVGAGLLVRSFLNLQRVDPGFEPAGVLAVPLELSGDEYREPWQKAVFLADLRRDLEALPGVAAVGATAVDPFSALNLVNDVTPVERAAEVGPSGYLQAAWRVVTPGFFEAMGMRLRRGRVFSTSDRWDGPRLAVITETMADRLWPETDPVGQRFYWGGTDGTPLTVVGVVGAYRDVELGAPPQPMIFLPHNQLPWASMTLVARTVGGTAGTATAIRNAIAAAAPTLAVPPLQPLDARLSEAVAGPRFRTLLLGFFSAVALLLAGVGIYGVMAFSVAQRTREIGIRRALGAGSAAVSRLFLRRAVLLAVIGAGVGVIGALALSRFLEELLYQTTATDTVTFLAAPLVLGAVAILATWAPVRRALRVDPNIALRNE